MLRFPARFLALVVHLWLCSAVLSGGDVHITCLDRAEGAKAIVDDRLEPYFGVLQDAEMAAKTGSRVPGADLAARRVACRERYAAAVEAFTAEEAAALTSLTRRLQPYLLTSFPLMARTPWRFIKLGNAIEGGLPHTRGTCIVFSPLVLREMVHNAKNADQPRAFAEAATLLAHEQSHVLARLHPQLFHALYRGTWNMVRMATAPAMPAALLARQLINPDGVDCAWAWKDGSRYMQPNLLLSSADGVPRMPHDFQMVAMSLNGGPSGPWSYATQADGSVAMRELMTCRSYVTAFAPTTNIYHPNETFAGLLEVVIRNDIMKSKALNPAVEQPAVRALRAWCLSASAAATR